MTVSAYFHTGYGILSMCRIAKTIKIIVWLVLMSWLSLFTLMLIFVCTRIQKLIICSPNVLIEDIVTFEFLLCNCTFSTGNPYHLVHCGHYKWLNFSDPTKFFMILLWLSMSIAQVVPSVPHCCIFFYTLATSSYGLEGHVRYCRDFVSVILYVVC